MVVGGKKFGVVSYVIFPPQGLYFVRFLKQIFGYSETDSDIIL
jgi:hypothetical protein